MAPGPIQLAAPHHRCETPSAISQGHAVAIAAAINGPVRTSLEELLVGSKPNVSNPVMSNMILYGAIFVGVLGTVFAVGWYVSRRKNRAA